MAPDRLWRATPWIFSWLASALVLACALCAPAKAQGVDQPGGDVQWERRVPLTPSVQGAKAAKRGSADAAYSSLGTFRNQSYAAGGATQQVFNTITRMAADDLNLVGSPPYSVNGFRFTVTNLNAVDVSASMLVRFYLPDGAGGGPGTYIAGFTYNPIVFTAGVVGTIKTSTKFVLPSSSIWAGIAFDNNGGSTGATAAQLDNLAQGIFSPPEVGTSTDRYFVTTAAGSFASDNPGGTLGNFGGAPPADFGWEILTAQDVDLAITVSDGVATAFPGGSVVYTVTAANAGPNTVFGARVVDAFPAALACSWTCAGSAGNTCAASGTGDVNDATVNLVAGGSVTYTATCTVSATATGTLVNTATIFAPGTAVEASLLNNTATDTDAIGALADLSITKTDGVTTATPGGNVTYTITAANAGPGNAAGATVADTLPASLTCSWTCVGAGGGSCTASGSGNVNDTVNLPAGGSVTYTANCTISPAATGTLANTATVAAPAGVSDPVPGNNAATDTDSLVTIPGAPAIGAATAGNAQATVAFSPPASNGGAPITSYTVTSTPAGISAIGAASPITVSGLSNGTVYTFTVRATNAVGSGPASAPSNSVTPATIPGAPPIAIATAGDTQAQVAFTPPASNGGSPITGYTTTSSPGGFSASGPGSPLVVSGLANGTAYTFTVTAANAVGAGPASPPSNSVIPAAVPGAPTIGSATAGNAQATVTFTPPASSGGSPIAGYTVTSSPGAIGIFGTASPITVTGLANGTAYTFTVTATNGVGTGPASAPSNSVTPATVPGAPPIAIAAAGDTQAGVAFTPPASNGGSPITSYTVTSAPGGFTAAGPASPLIVSGLTNGMAYSFTVTATNAVGTGAASPASNSVTPAAVPGPPTIGTATAGVAQATITFTPPASSGGSPITGYTATSSPGGISASGPASPITVPGLAGGTAYTFTVTATNAVGTGLASAPSNSVTPPVVPGAPTTVTAAAGNAQATVAFTPPVSNGGSPITSYTVTSLPGGASASGASSPITVGGLGNGTAYTFTVQATNAVGTGPASAASNSVTPSALPGAPTILSATAGNAQATVAFTPPASDGGSPITSYTATCGAFSATGAASPLVVTGLTNGTAYSCTVTATNARGTGPASAAVSVTPRAVPGAPVIGIATAGSVQATVAFSPPASDGGSPITTYTATSSPGGIRASGPASPITVNGLANGTAYTFTVTATSALGTGPASAASNSVTPASVPGAPTIVAANPRDGQATIAFTPPASNGGLPITSYTATCGAFSATGPASPLVVTGLTNGTAYSCTVTARNALGTGPASSPTSVTPASVVRSYTAPSATGSGTLTAVFTGGGLTCTFTTSDFIALAGDPASPPAGSITAITFPHGLFDFALRGCIPGSTITMTIAYPAALPPGTQYWKYGPEPGTPAPHWYILPATITGSTVQFAITDGGQGDDDLVSNGMFADQGGPGVPPSGAAGLAPVPTLSQWAMMLLALLLLGFAAKGLRHRT